jgi:cell division protein FtsW
MAKKPDYVLLGIVLALIVLGILILASVSASFSQERYGTTYYFLNHQVLFGLIPGFLLSFLVFKIKLNFLKKWAPILLLVNLIFLVMVFLPIVGSAPGGAARWVSLGPFSFQPSEFLKLSFILYLAAWLTSRTSKEGRSQKALLSSHSYKSEMKGVQRTFIAFLLVVGIISLLLILQPDISTLGVVVVSATLMYFLANTPLWHSILIVLIGGGGLLALIKLAPYRFNRLLVFLNPELDPMGIGYQIKQALITVGSGGLFGLGLGMSQQRFSTFLPQSMSDSIFAIFAEETGFAGAAILILIFLLLLWRGFRIAKMKEDKFSQLTALGITIWLCLQGFINIGAMIGILPLTGIPLPFISYGGSALVAELTGAGILLNISKT